MLKSSNKNVKHIAHANQREKAGNQSRKEFLYFDLIITLRTNINKRKML